MQPVRGVLLDLDGVLHISMQPVPGAAEVLSWLEKQGYPTGFVTNTTTLARTTLAQRLQAIGLPVAEQQRVPRWHSAYKLSACLLLNSSLLPHR